MNRTRRTVGALVVVAALLSMVAAFGQALPSGATGKAGPRPRALDQTTDPFASPDFTVTVDKTAGLHDGDTIHITVTPRPGVHVDAPSSSLGGNTIQECVASTTATSGDEQNQSKCPLAVYSPAMPSSAGKFYWYPDGSKAVGTFVVGVGTAKNKDGTQATCDQTHSCRLVLDGSLNGLGAHWIDASTVLTFAPATTNTVSGCNGLSPNPISSAGPDRLADVWGKWQSSECSAGKTPGGTQSTTVSFPTGGEAMGLSLFSQGTTDLAYSAVGPDTAGFTPGKSRPYVAIPIGLDASVLALAGGHATSVQQPVSGVPIGLPQPFTNVRLTIPEIAELVSRGPTYSQSVPQILAANPTLDTTNGLGELDQKQKVWAPAGPNSLSLFSSSAFVSRAAAQWHTPAFENDKPRGVVTDFAVATPEFSSGTTNTYSSRAVLATPVWAAFNSFANSGQDFVHETWLLTDFATADFYAATPVQVQTGKGDFVAPTPASIQAAVPTMQTAKDGMLRPDPSASADHAGAYPLSFVEYAIAPAQPLVSATCTLRSGSQKLLSDWLTYITTDGQSNLADGLVPLTPALKQQAAEAIANVGKSPTTGACAGKVKAPNGKPVGSTGKGAGGGGAGGFGAGGGAGGFGAAGGIGPNGASVDNAALGGSGFGGGSASPSAETSAGALGFHATKAPTAASRRQAAQAAEQASIKMPSFLGATPVSALIPPVSLLLITLITYIAGLGTSGRPMTWPRFGRRRQAAGGPPRLGWLRRLRPAQ